jgi:hypothetical protein
MMDEVIVGCNLNCLCIAVHGATSKQLPGMKTTQGGVNPSFIFLQLFQNQCFRYGSDSDLHDGLVPLPNSEVCSLIDQPVLVS